MTEQSGATLRRRRFEVGSTLVMIVLASLAVWEGHGRLFESGAAAPSAVTTPTIPKDPIQIGSSATMGSFSAPAAIVEYADFECPACAEFGRNLESVLVKQYLDTGRVLFVYKNFPLLMHPHALAAARAARCAGQQGKFWQMHDRFFAAPNALGDADLQSSAEKLGLDTTAYETCRVGNDTAREIQAEKAEGEALKVAATPTFFFGKLTSDRRVKVTAAMAGARREAFLASVDMLLK